MTNKKIRKWPYILVAGLVLIVLSACLTYGIMESKANINSEDFVGTYSIKAKMPDEYLSILPDTAKTTDQNYYLYNASKTSITNGRCSKTNDNYATLYAENGSILGTVVYLNESYYFMRNGQKAIKLTKIDDEPVTPN